MKNTLKYLMFAVALVFVLGINRVEALSVEEKWQQIADAMKTRFSFEHQTVLADDKSITITANIGDTQATCKFTLEDGIIIYDDTSDGLGLYGGQYLSTIINTMIDMFNYGDNFGNWFQNNFQNLKFDKDGFEIKGEMSEPHDTVFKCYSGAGVGAGSDWFANMYCNESTGNVEEKTFVMNYAKIDLNRGFVTYDPTYSSPTGTLSVGEKWNKIANDLELYSAGAYTVDSDDQSITITAGSAQAKFTLEDGAIVYNNQSNNGLPGYILTTIIYTIKNMFNYGNNFDSWFINHYSALSFEKDGFEITGKMSEPYDTGAACESGIGVAADLFGSMYCNESTGKVETTNFIINHVKIDLNRGFVTYDPSYNSATVEKTKEEVKVPDTLSNISTAILVVAGICILAGVGIIYYNSKHSHQV